MHGMTGSEAPEWAFADARRFLTRCRIGLPPFVEKVEGGRRGQAWQKEET